jgi:CheY-like chemotaxis protein
MNISKQARVLVVDDDPIAIQQVEKMLHGMACIVQLVTGSGQQLVEDATQAAKEFRPHVAVVDLELVKGLNDRLGLELLDHFSSAYCVAYSSYLDSALYRRLRDRPRVQFVDKDESPQSLIDAVHEGLRITSAAFRGFAPAFPSAFDERTIIQTILDEDARPPCECVADVLLQLFLDATELSLRTVGGEAASPTSVSRGHSFVAMGHPDNEVARLIKISPMKDMQREEENYRKYIVNQLGGDCHAQMTAHTLFWELGGAAYAFIGTTPGQIGGPIPFREFYSVQTDPKVILQPLHYFFHTVWGERHYRARSRGTGRLFDAYDAALSLRKRLEAFTNNEERRIAFPGFDHYFTHPVTWVLRHQSDSPTGWLKAVTHGDLHADNFFVDDNRAWAIDFERTGEGHALRDFAELEVDILTRLAISSEKAQAYRDQLTFVSLIEVLLAPTTIALPSDESVLDVDADLNKAYRVIVGLRTIAREVTSCNDAREYYWALLLDAVFVASLVKLNSPQRDRALILASLLCDKIGTPRKRAREERGLAQDGHLTQFTTQSVNRHPTFHNVAGGMMQLAPDQGQVLLQVLAQATQFLFGELGKQLDFWRSRQRTEAPTEIQPGPADQEPSIAIDGVQRPVRMDVLQRNTDRIESLQTQIGRWMRQLNRLEEQRPDLQLSYRDRVSLDEDIQAHRQEIEMLAAELENLLREIYVDTK